MITGSIFFEDQFFLIPSVVLRKMKTNDEKYISLDFYFLDFCFFIQFFYDGNQS